MSIIPPDDPRQSIKFEPLVIPPTPSIEQGISQIERTRAWSDTNGQPGIRTLLGEKNGAQIEEILRYSGASVVEVGAGKLEASKELALKNPQSKLIAIDPFIQASDLTGLPININPMPKRFEDITDTDIPENSIDGVFSGGHTWNYIEDKLAFIQKVWRMLKEGGKGYIEYIGSPMAPSIEQIINRFHLEDTLQQTTSSDGVYVIEINKKKGTSLDLPSYGFTTLPAGNFAGDVNTEYSFK